MELGKTSSYNRAIEPLVGSGGEACRGGTMNVE